MNYFQYLQNLFSYITPVNILDIGIITCLVYFVISWLKGTRAFGILATFLGIGVFYHLSAAAGLVLTSVLFQYLGAAIIVVLVIVFQPEIRAMLDRVSPIRYLSGRTETDSPEMVDEIVRAAAEMARTYTGALLVFQRTHGLESVALAGTKLGATVSAETLLMIFQKQSPLHDGACLIEGDRIRAVGCILPLSKDETLGLKYGTRHRAALGITERSDAVCVVVSEERGEVSIAERGILTVYRRKEEFKDRLEQAVTEPVQGRSLFRSILAPFTQNVRLKLLSLATAVMVWLIVVGPQRSELGLTIPIQYTNLAAGMEITGQWMEKVDVRIRGSESGIANLKPGAVRAIIELSQVMPGLNCFRITEKNLMAPPGVTISQIRPHDLFLNIEASSSKKLNVVPMFIGELPERSKIFVNPPEVKVRGFQDDLKKLVTVTTEPINVADLLSNGKVTVSVILKPDGLRIEAMEPLQVTVMIETEKQQ